MTSKEKIKDILSHRIFCCAYFALDEAGKNDVTQATKEILKITENKQCLWKSLKGYDEYDGYWETGCGMNFALQEGTLEEANMKRCPYCGEKIREER